jgi:hypothetical protein
MRVALTIFILLLSNATFGQEGILDDPAALFDPKIMEAQAWKLAAEKRAEQEKIKRQQNLANRATSKKENINSRPSGQHSDRVKSKRINPVVQWQAQWMARQMRMVMTPYVFTPPRR